MNNETINLLIIDPLENNYHQVKQLLEQGFNADFYLKWVSNYTEANDAIKQQKYDAYLLNYQVENFQDWCLEVNPSPVILITNDEITGRQALAEGISDYLLEEQLNPVLLEHSLRLCIAHSRTKLQLQKFQENVQTEKAESRKLYKNLAEHVAVGMYQNDTEGNCIYVNPKTCQLLDITLKECLGDGWINRLHPDDATRVVESWSQAFANQTFWQEEYRFLHRDGTVVWVMAQGVFIFDQQGNNTGSLGTLTDITTQKQLEQNLQKSQQFIEILLKTIPLSIFWQDKDAIFQGCNQIFLDFHGIKNKEDIICQKTFNDFFTENEANYKREDDLRVMESKQPKLFIETTFTKSNGQQGWLELHKAPLIDEQGEVIGIMSIFQDITERKVAEETLRISETRYRNLVETLPEIIYTFSSQRGTLYVSQQVEFILGYSPTELQECLWLWNSSIHQEDVELVRQAIQNCLEGQRYTVEYRIQDRQGKWHWFYDRSISSRKQGQETIIEGFAIDITERKKAGILLEKTKNELEKANKILEILVNLDGLTQIPNRRYFDEYLIQEWSRLKIEKQPLSLLIIDIDYFKIYNDTYGHLMGDEAIKLVAKTLELLVLNKSVTYLVARYGGEEFAVILPNTNQQDAEKIANNMMQEIYKLGIVHERLTGNKYLTISIGISTVIPNQNQSIETLINQADNALYKAKQGGRNQISIC